MFQNAYARLENIVMPILTAWLQSDGGVAWNMGAGLIVNEDGDFITAAHVLTCISRPPEAGNPPGSYTTKFGTTEAVFDGGYIHEELDFGWGKLKGYTHPTNHQYPVFRSGEVLPGELLCRIGYPFIEEGFQPRWNNRTFEFFNIGSIPQFINEALVSRFVDFPLWHALGWKPALPVWEARVAVLLWMSMAWSVGFKLTPVNIPLRRLSRIGHIM